MQSPSISLALALASIPLLSGLGCSNGGGAASGGAPPSDAGTLDTASPRYAVGGTVVGLLGEGLVLGNGGETVAVSPSGGSDAFRFPTAVSVGSSYAVSVLTQPSNPAQRCTVSAGSGVVSHGDVNGVVVNCSTDTFVVGGTVTGAEGTGLVLTDNGGDSLAVNGDGTFAFATPVASGGAYSVAVAASPSFPAETCTVNAGSGTVVATDVTSVEVTCTPNGYSVGGSVTGLSGSGLVLGNGGDTLQVMANGPFAFADPVSSGSPFDVAVTAQPMGQVCSASANTGTVGTTDVASVVVTCAASGFTVSGTVSGLAGGGLVLSSSVGSISVDSNGAFALPVPLASGTSFDVQVLAQPSNPAQTCMVSGGSGVVADAGVASIQVTCVTSAAPPGGTIAGALAGLTLGESIVLQDQASNLYTVSQNGPFTLTTTLPSGTAYNLSIQSLPSSPVAQTCTLANGSGTIGSVTNVVVNCDMLAYFPFSGNADDASGYGNDGAITNAMLTTGNTGDANGAYAFAGNGFIQVSPPSGFLPSGDASRTLTAWLQPTQSTGEWGVVYWGTGNCTGLQFGIGDQGDEATFWGGCDDDISGPAIPVSSPGAPVWTFVAISYSQDQPTSATLYVNDTPVPVGIGSALVTDASTDLVMGADLINGVYFVGNVDSVRVYGHALSASEIESIYTSGAL